MGPIGLETAGVSVTLGGEDVLIFASLEYMIADLDGHRAGLDWKGANGYRPCFRHMNVLKKNSETVEEGPIAGFVEISCPDPTRFKACEATDIYAAADSLAEAHGRVQARAMTADRFDKLQNVLGLRFAPEGVLLDASLRGIADLLDSRPLIGSTLHCRMALSQKKFIFSAMPAPPSWRSPGKRCKICLMKGGTSQLGGA